MKKFQLPLTFQKSLDFFIARKYIINIIKSVNPKGSRWECFHRVVWTRCQ